MSRHKPKRPCSTCGRTTQALDGICRVCTREAREHENALTGGNWRFDPFRRVQVWVPDAAVPVLRAPEPEPEPEPEPIDELPEGVACGLCGAGLTESCRTRNGIVVSPHAARRIPRQCPCGETVKPKRRLCSRCATKARRAAVRRYEASRYGRAA